MDGGYITRKPESYGRPPIECDRFLGDLGGRSLGGETVTDTEKKSKNKQTKDARIDGGIRSRQTKRERWNTSESCATVRRVSVIVHSVMVLTHWFFRKNVNFLSISCFYSTRAYNQSLFLYFFTIFVTCQTGLGSLNHTNLFRFYTTIVHEL